MSFIDKIHTIDRRIIFLCIALSVIIPMLFKWSPAVKTSPIVQAIFDKIDGMPEGSKVLISFDYGPATVPENQPMADGLTRHCMIKGHRTYMMAVWPMGEAQANITIDTVITKEFAEKVYGEDYIQLGYKAGNQGLINAIYTDLKGMYNTDAAGADINSFPIMQGIEGLPDFDLILCIGSGKPGVKEWIQFAGDRGNIPISGGVTAVEAPLLYPYYPKQLLGLMGGLQGAAAFEAALVKKYPEYEETSSNARKLMGPQTVAHFVIIIFVIIGNVAFFAQRRRDKHAREE
ncbi:hypothetical protein HQ587_03255 [bacterium]|nr:hypothetical protein [bacterium]